MKCKNCGIEFKEGIICPECGNRIEENISISVPEQINNANLEKGTAEKYQAEKKIENEGKTMAVLSLICGLFSLVTMGILFIPEILGIIFACFGKKQGKMRGQAKAGLICSLISLVIIIAALMSPSRSDDDTRDDVLDIEDAETSVVVEEQEITDILDNKEEVVEPDIEESIDNNTDAYEFDETLMYNIIPYSTCGSGGEDLRLYMNLVWNEEGSVDLYGFGYSYGEPVEEFESMVHLTPDPDYENWYTSDYKNFMLVVQDTYYVVNSNGDNGYNCFTGDFSLVTEESETFIGDYIEVLYGQIPNFFRDSANINSAFKCNLYYTGYESYFDQGYHFLHYIDETGAQITFIMEAKPNDPRFFYADLVTVRGVYTDQYDPKADIYLKIFQ